MKPLFEIVHEDLKGRIERGELRYGDRLYSSRELCELYKISNMTAVKVAAALKNDGLVKSIRGKGAFVCRRTPPAPARKLKARAVKKLLFLSIKSKDKPHSFLWRIGRGVQEEASRRGLSFRVDYTLPSSDFLQPSAGSPFADEDAVICLAPAMTLFWASEALAKGVRIISLDSVIQGMEAILFDNYRGVLQELDMLESLGHRRIVFCSRFSCSQNFVNENERAYAFEVECERRKLQGELEMASGFDKLESLLRRSSPPTAFMFSQDSPALQFIARMEAKGFSVPRDFSVVGFDGHSETEPCLERLSTCAVDCEGMGRLAVATLFEKPFSGLCMNLVKRVPGRLAEGRTAARPPI